MINHISSSAPTVHTDSAAAPASQAAPTRPFGDYFYTLKENTENSIGFATIKPELKEEFRLYYQARQKEAIEAQKAAAAEVRRNPVKLTWEQRNYLRKQYDPRNMSRQEYLSFIDDLLEFGILKESEAAYLDCDRGIIPIWDPPSLRTAFASAEESDRAFEKRMLKNPVSRFADCAGNVLDWARYQASYLSYDFTTHTEYPSTQDLAFRKMYRVLREM